MSELAAADNWDEDFEFSQETGSGVNNHDQIFNSISTRSVASDDWDADMASGDLQAGGARTNRQACQPTHNTTAHLGRISEKSSAASIPKTKPQETEVWDDDFESASGSSGSHQLPARRVESHSRSSSACIQSIDAAQGHWNDEAAPSTRRATRHNNKILASDDDGDFGIGVDHDEEQTITGRSRKPQARSSPPPPVPALPQSLFGAGVEPFPRSPTVSTLSGPAPSTAGQSTGQHPSTSYLALADGTGMSRTTRPAAQEAPKERRRLRKKSRPRHLHEYNNTFELIDPHDLPSASEPTTSEAERTSTPPGEIDEPSPSHSSTSKASSFLSRVGSWGGQKKRSGSSTPSFQALTTDGVDDRTPRKHGSHSGVSRTRQSGGWFSRRQSSRHRDEVYPTSSSDASPASQPRPTHKASLAQLRASQTQESPTKQSKRKPSRIFGDAKGDIDALPRRSTSSKRPSSAASGSITLNFNALPLLARGASKRSVRDDSAHVGILGVKKPSLASEHKTHRATKTVDSLPTLSVATEVQPRSELSPPIELQPPSPANTSHSEQPSVTENAHQLMAHASPGRTASIQAASLGRNSPQVVGSTNASTMRRNSLGDLKIPSRISQAQNGLKRDLGLVREFAAKVELLKSLQATYRNLLKEVQNTLDNLPPSRGPSSFVNLSRPPSRARSNTNPIVPQSTRAELSLAAQELHNKYRVPWECAELLIEMGGGTPVPSTDPSPSNGTVPSVTDHSFLVSPKSRERAITLSGNQAKPPVIASDASSALWRASTGRNDLSQRQLVLLRDMLHQADADNLPIPEGTVTNRGWRWGDAMASKATILSEESEKVEPARKRKSRMGLVSLRDMLKALRQINPKPQVISESSSPNSSENGLPRRRSRLVKKKGSKGQPGMASTTNLGITAVQVDHMAGHRPSPRRPSLANLFRMGQKKLTASDVSKHVDEIAIHPPRASQESTEEEDWDHMDSASDPEASAPAAAEDVPTATAVNGRSPYLQARRSQTPSTRHPSASRSSIFGTASSPFHSIARFVATEDAPAGARSSKSFLNGRKRSSMPGTAHEVPPSKTSTIRSAPPPVSDTDPTASQIKLAMTPENIKPLLESACEVLGQLEECVEALRSLLVATTKPS